MHEKFVLLVIKGFCNFLSQMADGLEITHTHLLFRLVVSVEHKNIQGLDVWKMGWNLHLRLQSALTIVPINKLRHQLYCTLNHVVVVRVFSLCNDIQALFNKSFPNQYLVFAFHFAVKSQVKIHQQIYWVLLYLLILRFDSYPPESVDTLKLWEI